MKLLVVVATYPFPARAFAGAFNERSVLVLKEMCEVVEVLAPRPFAPPWLSPLHKRWRAYSSIQGYEFRNGVHVYRPAYLQVPRIAAGFSADKGAFLRCRRLVRRRHEKVRFDAILAFDLAGAGGLAWRLGEDLGIPAAGWATGGDLWASATSGSGRVAARALRRLDLVFYQSHELRASAASRLGENMRDRNGDRHIVLSRGILPPPVLDRAEVRRKVRAALGIGDEEQLLLSIGRVTRAKGVFELVDGFAIAAAKRPNLRCAIIGAHPGFDDSDALETRLRSLGALGRRVAILPACSPNEMWEFLCAGDVFGFTSHHEGAPNSLLEAMAMGVPAVAFAIPAVLEIEAGSGGLVPVPPFDTRLFGQAVVDLCESPSSRARIAESGRAAVLRRFDARRNMATALGHIRKCTEPVSSIGRVGGARAGGVATTEAKS